MTHEEFQSKVSGIPDEELISNCREALSNLCKTGGNSFRMTVPPQISDTDILFSQLIERYDRVNKGRDELGYIAGLIIQKLQSANDEIAALKKFIS